MVGIKVNFAHREGCFFNVGHMSTDISADTRPICQPIHRWSLGRYVERDVDRDVDRYIGQGVHKIHMIQFLS